MKKKEGVVTFKVDQGLYETIKDMPNRSEFIRSAILNALGNVCPLCNGAGVLTPNQQEHWNDFNRFHKVQKCDKCNELTIVCIKGEEEKDNDEA